MSAAAKAELMELRASFTRLQDDAEELATRLLYALEEEKIAKQQLSALVEPAKQRASTSAGVAERQLQASLELLKAELQASNTQLASAVAERDAALARCAELESAVGLAASRALSSFEATEIRARRGGGEDGAAQPSPVVPDDIMDRLRRRNAKRDTLNLDVADPWR
jgi:chromosome segregation ATPase